jgi:hypothetical protein
MLSLLLIAMMPVAAEEPGFDRMVQCSAYHWQWQLDENKAGKKVYEDTIWFLAFRDKMRAAGAAQGLSRYQVSDRMLAILRDLGAGLTPEQNADWAKCQKESGWAPDPGGKTIN